MELGITRIDYEAHEKTQKSWAESHPFGMVTTQGPAADSGMGKHIYLAGSRSKRRCPLASGGSPSIFSALARSAIDPARLVKVQKNQTSNLIIKLGEIWLRLRRAGSLYYYKNKSRIFRKIFGEIGQRHDKIRSSKSEIRNNFQKLKVMEVSNGAEYSFSRISAILEI